MNFKESLTYAYNRVNEEIDNWINFKRSGEINRRLAIMEEAIFLISDVLPEAKISIYTYLISYSSGIYYRPTLQITLPKHISFEEFREYCNEVSVILSGEEQSLAASQIEGETKVTQYFNFKGETIGISNVPICEVTTVEEIGERHIRKVVKSIKCGDTIVNF